MLNSLLAKEKIEPSFVIVNMFVKKSCLELGFAVFLRKMNV